MLEFTKATKKVMRKATLLPFISPNDRMDQMLVKAPAGESVSPEQSATKCIHRESRKLTKYDLKQLVVLKFKLDFRSFSTVSLF